MEAKRADPLQEALPALVLFGTFIVIMLVIFGGSNTSVDDDSDAVAEATETAAEVVAVDPSSEAEPDTTADADTEEDTTEEVVVEDAGFKTFDTQLVNSGQLLYQVNCAGCHGMDGQGMPGLGKNLVDSEFVDNLNADGFVAFTVVGRQPFDPMNSSGVLMPARGGNPGLTDEDLHTIYTFLRAQTAEYDGDIIIYADDVGQYDNPAGGPWGEEVAMADTPDMADTADTEESVETAEEVVDSGEFEVIIPDGSIALTDLPFDVAAVYGLSCAGCHGADGNGVEGYGSALVDVDPDAAFTLLTTVSSVTDMDVITGVPHPVRGEPATLTDEQLRMLVDYLDNIGEPVEIIPAAGTSFEAIIPDGSIAVTDLPFDAAAVYGLSCAGCHGVDGTGVEPLASAFGEIDTDAAFTLLTTLVSVTDLDAEGGMIHPVRAEPAILTDGQLSELVDYLVTLGE